MLSALQQLGFRLSVLLGAAGIFTIAIGLATQTSAANLISGFFLIFDQSFKLDDMVAVNNVVGKVHAIDALSVKLVTCDNEYIRIPNDTLIKAQITNLTHFKTKRASIKIGVRYPNNLQKIKTILLQQAEQQPYTLDKPKPVVIFNEFNETKVYLQLLTWVDVDKFDVLLSELKQTLIQALSEQGIEDVFMVT
jgi:small-conductance mechanosensitive channel